MTSPLTLDVLLEQIHALEKVLTVPRIIVGHPFCMPDEVRVIGKPRPRVILLGRIALERMCRELELAPQVEGHIPERVYGIEIEPYGTRDDHWALLGREIRRGDL